ncbi:Methanogenic corrinoid protein MtbC1 [Friedmanniella luteola]|uniref:Methanogenic corrinoid protein MtbC1 n=1 Tax=Friedmanniella luteola TaxID=546871 RepID=A0A1H1W9W9_9ACTN|nr:B12-binding domain-containing protein [Friedmanniella luteola]SDS93845.1 Methanogenic corrinoid protein MtbC1 [Friedmanniella luteola]
MAPTASLQQPDACAEVLNSCRRLDGWGLRQLLDRSRDERGLDRTVAEVLLPALRHIGERWASGEIGVAHEHLFSSTAERWLHAQLRPVAPATRAPLALLACGPGETHAVALNALETLLNHRGWATDHLGASTPASSLRTAVRVTRPAAVVVVAHLPQNRPGTVRALAGVGDLVAPADLFYAGGAFVTDADREGVPGTYLGADLVAAADHVAGRHP